MHHLKKILPQKSLKQKKQDGSPSPSATHAGGLANPTASIGQLAVPLNPTDRPSSTPPIGYAHRSGSEYEPPQPNPAATSTTASPLESQPLPDIAIHGPPSVPHVISAVQGGDKSVLPHLDLASPRAVAPYNNRLIQDGSNSQPLAVDQASSSFQHMNDAAPLPSNLGIPQASSHNSRSAPDNSILQPSPTPANTTLQGAVEYVLLLLHSKSINIPCPGIISAPDKSTHASTQSRVFTVGKAMLKTLGAVTGVPTLDDFVELLEVS